MFLDFHRQRCLGDFTLYFSLGLLKFPKAFAKPSGELRKFLGPEKQETQKKYEDKFR